MKNFCALLSFICTSSLVWAEENLLPVPESHILPNMTLLAPKAEAAKPYEPNVSIEGEAQFGYSGILAEGGDDYYLDAKIEFDTQRRKGVKANIEIKGSDTSRDFALHDAYIDWRFSENKNWSLRFGREKRTLGYDAQDNPRSRLGLNRSPLYNELSNIHWTGRDLFVGLRWRGENEYKFRLYSSKTKDASLIFSSENSLSSTLSWSNWLGLLMYGRTSPRKAFYFLGTGLRHQNDNWRTEFEIHYGGNPLNTALISTAATERKSFLSTRLGVSRSMGSYTPFVHLSYFIPTVSQNEGSLRAITSGLKYALSKRIDFSLETDFRHRTSYIDSELSSWNESSYNMAMRYFF